MKTAKEWREAIAAEYPNGDLFGAFISEPILADMEELERKLLLAGMQREALERQVECLLVRW